MLLLLLSRVARVDISLTVRVSVHGILADLLPGAGRRWIRTAKRARRDKPGFIVLVLSPSG